jgi:GT2 family glycosyltransferase
MEEWGTEESRPVEVLKGACLFLRGEAINQVGLLDESYYMYTEEVDYCYRLHKAGWQLYWVPEAKVIHYGGQSTKQIKTEMFLRLYESKTKYFNNNFGKLHHQIYKIILFFASLARLSVIPFTWFIPSSQREKHLALARLYSCLVTRLSNM